MLEQGLPHLRGATGPRTGLAGSHLPSLLPSISLPPPPVFSKQTMTPLPWFSWTPQLPPPRGPMHCILWTTCSSLGFSSHWRSNSIPLQGCKMKHQLARGLGRGPLPGAPLLCCPPSHLVGLSPAATCPRTLKREAREPSDSGPNLRCLPRAAKATGSAWCSELEVRKSVLASGWVIKQEFPEVGARGQNNDSLVF